MTCRFGGLGLRNAVRTAACAYRASMADAARIIYLRFPAVASMIGDSLYHLHRPELNSHDDSLALQDFLDSQRSLIDEGMPVISS